MTADLLAKYDGRVPRYTSYPTANHFNPGIGAADYRRWLTQLDRDARLSLYLHVPFCTRLCWYCGCSTRAINKYGPVEAYVAALAAEIERIADLLPGVMTVGHIHWGGGTPTILQADDFTLLMERLHHRFRLAPDAEIAIEADPTVLAPALVAALAAAGVNRASIGVQDFDPAVQQAIGRLQPVEATADAIQCLRAAGIGAINIDLVYGLPGQTLDRLGRTLETVMDLAPDRIALFGYAHVPWMRRNQRLIDEAALPDGAARLAMVGMAAALLAAYDYQAVGIDHFARPHDPLARAGRDNRLHRNFQGYTTDQADALIGFGASAIGTLPQGFVQNTPDVAAYLAALTEPGGLATRRGHALSDDDRLRQAVIARIMCDFAVDLAAEAAEAGQSPQLFLDTLARLDAMAADGLIRRTGWRIEVTGPGRPFARCVAALFDGYLDAGEQHHARAV
jgi:oxygen-independent coproporphyrinogen-3 oxidase